MRHLDIALLGSFHVQVDGQPLTDFATDKVRALLAYLVLERDRPHRREALAGLLWPDQPDARARQNLRQALTYLRQTLRDTDAETPFILVERTTIEIAPSVDLTCDVAEFLALDRACAEHRHIRPNACLPCLQRLERMAALYRGPLLDQFALRDSTLFEEWAVRRREWLQQRAVDALAQLGEYMERRGEYGRAREYIWRQVTLEPWHEEAHRQLMRLLALAGQHSAALARYEVCRRALDQELGVEPAAETEMLREAIRRRRLPAACPPPGNLLPDNNPLVGREAELADIAERLANHECRLLSIVGVGGVGKTRLALQAATDQLGLRREGIWFVPLESATSGDGAESAIAGSLGLRFAGERGAREQLLGHLRGREMVLVLDGVEHLPEAADLAAEIVRHALGVQLLVTSRERLGLREEWVYELDGLSYPASSATGEANTHGAVELFRQRARQIQRRFALTSANLEAVVRICRLTEGLPLAVELAAAWTAARPCTAIADELEHNLAMLATPVINAPERQQSIRAAFDLSWRLLSDEEQHVFVRLTVFPDGFTAQGAALMGGDKAILEALTAKCMVRHDGERYVVHALLRRYGGEKLAACPGSRSAALAIHARHYLALLNRAADMLQGGRAAESLRIVQAEAQNIHQAWETAVEHAWLQEVSNSLEPLFRLYDLQGRFAEAVHMLERLIDTRGHDPAWAGVLARTRARLGHLLRHLGRYREAYACLEQALAEHEHTGDMEERVFCLVYMAETCRSLGQHDEAEALARRGLDLARRIGNARGVAQALCVLGMLHARAGDLADAEALLEESLPLARQLYDDTLAQRVLSALGDMACRRGDFGGAIMLFDEGLALSRALGDRHSEAIVLNNLGTTRHVMGEYDRARTLYAASLDICRDMGDMAGEAIALSNLGELDCERGAYPQAIEQFTTGLDIARKVDDQWAIIACLKGLGEAAGNVDDAATARVYLAEALGIAREKPLVPVMLEALTHVARFYARAGEVNRAIPLLALVCRHPVAESAVRVRAARTLAELGHPRTPEPTTGLDEVVAEVLAHLQARGDGS
jgi:DNA-binding SARP family transcriptional activator